MGLELKKAKHATELKEAIQKRDAQELQESPPLPTPASLNCKHPSGGALGGGEGCDLDSVEAPGRAGDGKDCGDEEAVMILDQILMKGLGNLEALESCVGPSDLMHAHFEKRKGKKRRSTWNRHCKDKFIAAVDSKLAKKVWQLLLTYIAFKKSEGA
mmetsp:Transcript_32824/g.52844  ORF Transcript_32824/g.52844 Transcript_32824/m.52844 type:complete len:157 (-) Transcript_32824:181-651(-)